MIFISTAASSKAIRIGVKKILVSKASMTLETLPKYYSHSSSNIVPIH